MKYFLLHPARFKLDGGAMFGIIPKPLWQKCIPADDQNRIELSLRVLLVQHENKHILIDTGIGNYHGEKFETMFGVQGEMLHLETCLEKVNLKPENITDIILTHLHFDHVGGLTKLENDKVTPVFPNATIHLHKKHYDYALSPTLRDGGSFQKKFFKPTLDYYIEKNQIQFLTEANEGSIEGLPINYKVSHGHTPWQIHPYTDDLIYMADIVPTSHHIKTAWVMGYDMNPGIGVVEKDQFYKFIQENNLTLVFEHDTEFWGAKITKNDKGHFICEQKFNSDKKICETIDL